MGRSALPPSRYGYFVHGGVVEEGEDEGSGVERDRTGKPREGVENPLEKVDEDEVRVGVNGGVSRGVAPPPRSRAVGGRVRAGLGTFGHGLAP